ncbi:MAG: response regulator transcription factor [Vicingaceae bacterium]
MPDKSIQITVVDDHQLFREGLIELIQRLDSNFTVSHIFKHGKAFLEAAHSGLQSDLILLDVNMPIMDGLTTLKELGKLNSNLKCLALSMKDDDITLIKILKAGAKGFLSKDAEPEELKAAILSVVQDGYFYPPTVANKLVGSLQNGSALKSSHKLNDQELKFVELACSEYTYQEIADKMCLSIKTIDGYRARLFEKLNVKSRIGIVLYAIRNHLISIDE